MQQFMLHFATSLVKSEEEKDLFTFLAAGNVVFGRQKGCEGGVLHAYLRQERAVKLSKIAK